MAGQEISSNRTGKGDQMLKPFHACVAPLSTDEVELKQEARLLYCGHASDASTVSNRKRDSLFVKKLFPEVVGQ